MENKKRDIRGILKWSMFTIAVITFIFLVYVVQSNKITAFDSFVYSGIAKFQGENMTKVVKILTEFGNYFILCGISIIITVILKDKKEKVFIWINLISISTINYILKQIFTRERPETKLILVAGYSFPSGHSAVSMAVYLFLIYLVLRRINIKWFKTTLVLIMSAMIILIGFSRVYLGAHFVSDVLAGFCIGIIYNILFVHFCFPYDGSKK